MNSGKYDQRRRNVRTFAGMFSHFKCFFQEMWPKFLHQRRSPRSPSPALHVPPPNTGPTASDDLRPSAARPEMGPMRSLSPGAASSRPGPRRDPAGSSVSLSRKCVQEVIPDDASLHKVHAVLQYLSLFCGVNMEAEQHWLYQQSLRCCFTSALTMLFCNNLVAFHTYLTTTSRL